MEIKGDGYGEICEFDPVMKMDENGGDDELDLSPNLFLDNVGEVILTINSDELSWKSLESTDNHDLNSSSCLGIKLKSKAETELKISDIYAVEVKNWGLIHQSVISSAGAALLVRDHGVEMYRFAVHGFKRSSTKRALWVLATYTFGNADLPTCQKWVDKINSFVNKEVGRPKRLLVIVTERAGHAFDVMASLSNKELHSYDGVVAVGGDGFFNEILNGLLASRHKAPYPPSPTEVLDSAKNSGSASVSHPAETTPETSQEYKEQDPLLPSAAPTRTGSGCDACATEGAFCVGQHIPGVECLSCQMLNVPHSLDLSVPLWQISGTDTIRNLSDTHIRFKECGESTPFPLPNERFRFGIIPSGSTDAIVICTTGARDPITSALQIIMGRSVRLDIAQVVRWKATASSKDAPSVRYAASFAGYGFYGDVIKESEKYRWMGPKRYDYAGTKVFLKHKSYEAEIAYLDVQTKAADSTSDKDLLDIGIQKLWRSWVPSKKTKREICRINCQVCNESPETNHVLACKPTATQEVNHGHSGWLRCKGRFLSIGGAVISCRNERAPDGLVANAHLADGLLDLILIKDCPHAFYLWHLTQLARKGGKPLNFEFVEHFKTPAFVFTSIGEESIWNLDGELLQAHQLSAQIFRGLITLFATGPDV